jgi:FlaA1/EpsC-like NDP-sugar epimerase
VRAASLFSPTAAFAVIDLLLVTAGWWIAFWIRFNLDIPDDFLHLAAVSSLPVLACYAAALWYMRVFWQVWRYTGLPELRSLALAALAGGLLSAAGIQMLRLEFFPRSVLLLHPLIVLILLGAVRAGWRTRFERRWPTVAGGQPLLIAGSLQDASDALRALKGSAQWIPVGILSPVEAERGRSLQNVRVLGNFSALQKSLEATGATTVLAASPSGSPARRELLLQTTDAGVTLLAMPRPDEWLKTHGPGPRKVELEDLLGREAVQLDVSGLAGLFSGQTVLVTGAGGSIGSELCRQIARFGVGKLVCVDVSEYAIYRLEQELREAHPEMQGVYYTANVREADRLMALGLAHRPAVVFHAAAYKHVPLMEQANELEAIRTNVLGTLHSATMAGECGARRFVMISTDKAVNPTNVMGASKRLAELMVQASARRYPQTQFVSVRFGNVLGSSGSVVPLFSAQIEKGGPVTVTHPEIVR